MTLSDKPNTASQATIDILEMRQAAFNAVRLASRMSRQIQLGFQFGNEKAKLDASPVTLADFAVQALIIHQLSLKYPSHKFIAEETSAGLKQDHLLLKQVLDVVNDTLRFEDENSKLLDETELCDAIDRGSHPGGDGALTWVLDPIDGTKGFMRKQQYCIALGLLKEGEAYMGVLGCPNLPTTLENVPKFESRSELTGGSIFHAIRGQGTYMQVDTDANVSKLQRVHVSSEPDPMMGIFMESVESAHSSHNISANVAAILGVKAAPIRMDSQVKYGVLARGEATILMRFPKGGYIENIWDHAAGVVVIEEAGGKVTDGTGRKLDFSLGRKLNNERGIVATNGSLHQAVIEAVTEAHDK